MNLKEYIEYYKNKNSNFQRDFLKHNNLSYQTYFNILKGILSKGTAKKIYFATNGKVKPNDLFGVSFWQQELQSQKHNKKEGQ